MGKPETHKPQGAVWIALLGLGWAIATLTLSGALSASEFAIVFGTIIFAECLTGLITQSALALGRRSEALGYALTAWVGLCMLALAAFRLDVLPFFTGYPLALIVLMGLTLAQCLTALGPMHRHNSRACDMMRVVTWATMWYGIDTYDTLTVDLALIGAAGVSLLILLAVMIWRNRQAAVPGHQGKPAPVNWVPYADLFILPAVLSGADALLYLLARAMVQIILSTVGHIERQAHNSLSVYTGPAARGDLIALAARLNLGLLLVGGGMAVVVLTTIDYIPAALGLALPGFNPVLAWLVLGASAPAFFGATGVLLSASHMNGHNTMMQLIGVVVFAVGAFALPPTATAFAQLYAFTMLAVGLLSAASLVKSVAIWPGLTAILLRQIKLL